MPDIFKIKGIIDLLTPHISASDHRLAADHDIIYFPCREKDLSPEVLVKLEELGAHWSSEGDCWAAFV